MDGQGRPGRRGTGLLLRPALARLGLLVGDRLLQERPGNAQDPDAEDREAEPPGQDPAPGERPVVGERVERAEEEPEGSPEAEIGKPAREDRPLVAVLEDGDTDDDGLQCSGPGKRNECD
jgi:hypothetical protein